MKKAQRRDTPQRQVRELVTYFRTVSGGLMGRDGDYNDLTPAETAVKWLRKLRAEVESLRFKFYQEGRKNSRLNNEQQWSEKTFMGRLRRGLKETTFPSAFKGVAVRTSGRKSRMLVVVGRGKTVETFSPQVAEQYASRLMRAAAEARVAVPE